MTLGPSMSGRERGYPIVNLLLLLSFAFLVLVSFFICLVFSLMLFSGGDYYWEVLPENTFISGK
jgi:hypothetical protein